MIEQRFVELVATETNVKPEQAAAAIALFDKGATIPFVARYRKDATGGLSENKLERIFERNEYFVALTSRRDALLDNIEKQGRLTDTLRESFIAADDHLRLEDLNLPFKKQRHNRAAIAVNKGLLPLADYIWAQSPVSPPVEIYAESFVLPEKQVLSIEEAVEGARHILSECIAMNADIRNEVRRALLEEGRLVVNAARTQAERNSRYGAFAKFDALLKTVRDDDLLIILRGERDGALRVELVLDDTAVMEKIVARFAQDLTGGYATEIRAAVDDAYRRLLRPAIEAEVFAMARRKADEAMVAVCRDQVRNLLLMAPAGYVPVLGICPWSTRKRAVVCVDDNGALLASRLLEAAEEAELDTLTEDAVLSLLAEHPSVGISVGSGPGGRETMRCAHAALQRVQRNDVFVTLVQDVGLSAYTHSPLAAEEAPECDEAVRAALSIARRLQDPMKELVKVDPAYLTPMRPAIGVNRKRLQAGVVRTIESVVSRIGVDVNTASIELLRYVSGLQTGVAQAIAKARAEREGGFTNRSQLLEVSGVGEKTYQQCIGFLRILGGDAILDASAIHPEAYSLIEKIAASLDTTVEGLHNAPERLRDADLSAFTDDKIGPLTLEDIRFELGRIGRDPRRRFRPPVTLVPLNTMDDLSSGMVIEGIITNVTDFGVFVSIGLPQEGLVHRSEVGRSILNDPKKTLQVGEVIKVLVLQVDKDTQKIALSIKGAAKLPLTKPGPRPFRGRDNGPEPAQSRDRSRFHEVSGRSREDGGRRPAPGASSTGDRGFQQNRPQRRKGKSDLAVPKIGDGKGRKSDDGLLNTTLADQLAALRDKIVSGK